MPDSRDLPPATLDGNNPNYRRLRDQTLSKVREALQKIQATNRSYGTLGELIKDVSIFSGVARSTIRPYRNSEAYHLVASFFGSMTIEPNKVPDEVADEYVLRIKLAVVRAENAELARKVRATKRCLSQQSAVAALSDDRTAEIFHAVTQLILRQHGAIQVNTKKGTIEDRFPERGFGRVVASGESIKHFAEWLKTHPTFGSSRILFVDD